MALDPGRTSMSPESSGRESPIPRQWRNQLGSEESAPKDKAFRKYASGVERTLALFETSLQEWADYISFLNRLLKALQTRPTSITTVPSRALVAKRLSQCLNPSLPSGVHQKTLEVYHYVFSMIGKDGLSRDLPLYLPGLASTLSFASLSVRSLFLDLLERHFLDLNPRSLRPAMKSIVLALLPGLEEETAEDFERTLKLLERFKVVVRPSDSEEITESHSSGDFFFWQCFLLASITSQSRRSGALAYLVRNLPRLGHPLESSRSRSNSQTGSVVDVPSKLSQMVTSPEPGLLLRCFAAGLADEQLLIQRGYLDLLVTHLPLHSKVLQTRVKPADLELLLRAAAGVVTRREMSLNRRLWAWLLGPEPVASSVDNESGLESPTSAVGHHTGLLASKTSYFEEYGLQPLSRSLLAMIKASDEGGPAERARPYRICLSLMDRWEIGGLVVPEVFLPVVDSVRRYKAKAPSKLDFSEVLRSASVFFDGVESGLIYGELLGLIAQAIGPGSATAAERSDKLVLVKFVLTHFNVREEEMVTIHAPLTALSILCMLDDAGERARASSEPSSPLPLLSLRDVSALSTKALGIAADLLDLVPERAFLASSTGAKRPPADGQGGSSKAAAAAVSNASTVEILKKIKDFYVNDQGNLDASPPPYTSQHVGELLLQKSSALNCESLLDESGQEGQGGQGGQGGAAFGVKSRIMFLLLNKTPSKAPFNVDSLVVSMNDRLSSEKHPLDFTTFSSALALSTNLYTSARIPANELSELVPHLVRHAWSFLSASEPKYHVETVRSLWQLQTALGPQNRDIEAAIAGLMIRHDQPGAFASRPSDSGRSFGVLWSHTLQDNPSGSDRRLPRTPRTPNGEFVRHFLPRLAGMDYYDVMLTRPLFLALDALLDERTQLFMTVKTWLNSMIGIDKLFSIFVAKFLSFQFLQLSVAAGDIDRTIDLQSWHDLDLCFYYMRALWQILRWAPESMWAVLAKHTVPVDQHLGQGAQQRGGTGDEGISFLVFFLQVCMRCIACGTTTGDETLNERSTQLSRCALNTLHQILLNSSSQSLADLRLEDILIERLSRSLSGPDPYVQVLLLDVVFASLRLRETLSADQPPSPTTEKRTLLTNLDPARGVQRTQTGDDRTAAQAPPPELLKCLQAGLSSVSSRAVLDSWVSFLGVCLPLYSDSIFQVLIPLVETLCGQINNTFAGLQKLFRESGQSDPALGSSGSNSSAPESTLISLLNALEQVLAKAHDRLLAEEARASLVKSPDQPQSFFGNIFSTDAPQARSATANDRLTVLLAFQDAVKICFKIWSWGQGGEAGTQDMVSAASFNFTSLRMRNRARRLLEHLFAAETLECLETVIDIWKGGPTGSAEQQEMEVLHLLPVLDSSRPRHTMPALFNAIYSRTSPSSLDPSRKSTLTIELQDTDIVIFLVHYARSLEDDAMDEIWQDCMLFLKDLLGNPFPHRQTLPSLLEFAATLGEKVDNTNFGEQKKMRRELGDLFLRLLAALFTTRPMTFADVVLSSAEKQRASDATQRKASVAITRNPFERGDDVVEILSAIVPNLPKVLVETDRVLVAAGTISASVIGPALRSKSFPDTISKSMLVLLQELSRLPNNQKTWKKDLADAFNDPRFFGAAIGLVRSDWLPLLRLWTVSDKERMPEIVARIAPPATAGIVFGVGATSARLEADRKTQLNLRRIATLILASATDAFVSDLPMILEKIDELLAATPTSSPSSTTRAELFIVVRALVLKTSAVHLAPLWPVINAELHAAISSVVAPDHSAASETYNNVSVLQACRLLDLLVCVAPDDFQLHEWLFVTDTIDAVYRSSSYRPVALADELSEELGSVVAAGSAALQAESAAQMAASSSDRRTLLGGPGGLGEDVGMERRDELVAKVLRPFFGQLSIFAFESTYAMGPVDWDHCTLGVLKDLFDERSIVRAL